MPDIGRIHTPFPEPGFLKREQAEQPADAVLNLADSALAPRPDLRSDQIINGYADRFQVPCQAEMEIRTVCEDRGVRRALPDHANQLPVLTIDSRKVPGHLGEAHNRKAIGVHYGFHTGLP
jgi:hypothetical protein